MARRSAVLERKYIFEYDVGQWTFGTTQVLQERTTGNLKTCKVVRKSKLQPGLSPITRLQALRRLQHPSVCNITDVLEDAEHLFIISDFLRGGDLQDWMERMDDVNWLQESTCASYIRQLLLAIMHCHSQQVYHGDLRLTSLLLTSKMPDAAIKVSDFGLAAILDPANEIVPCHIDEAVLPDAASASDVARNIASDIFNVGVIAHTLLIGRLSKSCAGLVPPSLSRSGAALPAFEDDALSERSESSRTFIKRCLRQEGHVTIARLLMDPWLKSFLRLEPEPFPKTAAAGVEEARKQRHSTLCYTLCVLILPAAVPVRDFDLLRFAFQQLDSDNDGLISQDKAQRLLLTRRNHVEAVKPALEIVDVGGNHVLDLCATACADMIVRDFFAAGPTNQPLCGPFSSTDLVPNLMRVFFEIYGERHDGVARCAVNLAHLRTRMHTATAKEIERHANVCYEDILEFLPDGQVIDSQVLTEQIAASEGVGTPLRRVPADLSPIRAESVWTLASNKFNLDRFNLDFGGLFHDCSVLRAQRDESPFSIRIA